MAKMKWQGLEEYEMQLMKLETISRTCVGQAIYEGAKIVADAVKQGINDLPIDERRVKNGEKLNGISSLQKQGLIESFGVAELRDENGYLNVKLGFDGYNGIHTATFPNGQPNAMIARSVNSGTSFRNRIPFVDNAVNSHKQAAEEAIKNKFDETLAKAID